MEALERQWTKQIIRVIRREVPKIIVEKKMRPLARHMWSQVIIRTARDTGRLQHFYRASVVRGNNQNALFSSPDEVRKPGKIREKDYYAKANVFGGDGAARKIMRIDDLFVIGSDLPYDWLVEEDKGSGKGKYRKPHMMQKSAEFMARNAKIFLR